jgi:hypothetical protein
MERSTANTSTFCADPSESRYQHRHPFSIWAAFSLGCLPGPSEKLDTLLGASGGGAPPGPVGPVGPLGPLGPGAAVGWL